MAWTHDGMHLAVTPANRTARQYRSPRTFKSFPLVTLWSDDDRQFLRDARKRCQALLQKPANTLNGRDKTDLLQGCR